MVESAATDKLTRWISKRETFTRRDAFMGTKGGVMRTVADFDTALAALVSEGVITLASEQPSRGIRYVVVSPSDQTQDIRSFASPVVASTPAPVEVARVEPAITSPPTPVVPFPLPPIQPPTPAPIKTVERTADDVLASATAKRRADPANWPGRGRLDDIERRYGKTAGDLLRGSDLHSSEVADLIRWGA